MNSSTKAYQTIKSDIKSKLQDMEKIEEESLTDRALHDKLHKIKEKLNKRRATLMESQEKAPLLSKSSIQKANKFIDIENDEEFRRFNIYIPKINLCQSTAPRTTFSQLKPNYEEHRRITSKTVRSLDNGLKNSEFKFRKLRRINNHKMNYAFFERKFVEFQYQDVSDKSKGVKKNNAKVYKAFKKLLDDNSNQLYQVSQNSIVLKYYDNLLKLEESNKYTELDEMRVREDDIIFDPKDEEEKLKKYGDLKRTTKNDSSHHNVNNLDLKLNENISNNFKKWFMDEVQVLKLEKLVRQPSSSKKRKSIALTDKPPEEGNPYGMGDSAYVTFTLFDKSIRLTDTYHQRILQIDGPMANWYRYKENQTSNTKKGTFDLRKITIEPGVNNPKEISEEKKEIFTVNFRQKGKTGNLEDKKVKFKSEFYKMFSDKTIRDIFEQIRRYYTLINNMMKLHRVDYHKLRFVSDPKITNLNIFREDNNPDTIKCLIDNIDWHVKLKRVHLRGVDKQSIHKFFSVISANNEILLESITIESTKNSHVIEFDSQSNNQLLNLMKTFFGKKGCARLSEFHLVDVKIPEIKPILDILRLKFAFVKKFGKRIQLSEDDLRSNTISTNNEMRLPFSKLSFKKSFDNVNSQINIDLNELYSFFKEMSSEFEGRFENVFECLDISGAECCNIEGLKLIINNFRIVRDLNISATKLYIPSKNTNTNKDKYVHSNQQGKQVNTVSMNSFLINNVDFIKSINFKENYDIDGFSSFHIKKEINLLSTTQQTTNNNIVFTNVEPILSNLFIHDTPISPESFTELLLLYKRLKFLRTIHLSDHLTIVPNGDHVKFNNALSDIKKEDEFYCENFFEIDYTNLENVK